jgi:hypothetical protein
MRRELSPVFAVAGDESAAGHRAPSPWLMHL